ncbi:hypothetical protein WMF27_11025 [Sorangium sp. So ce281]|uniref:hypothetical protein n=1 Tax=unclassified Sorangium TaxID=2621164 RepID=UPI003F61E4AE
MRTLATRAACAALGLCLAAAACGQPEPNLSGQGGAGGGSGGESAASSGGTTSSSSSGVDTTSSSSSGAGPDDTPVENESADCEVAALPEVTHSLTWAAPGSASA